MKVVLLMGSTKRGEQVAKELAKGLRPRDYAICSSSYFFMQNGVFSFDESKLNDAHDMARKKFKWAIKNKLPLIIVNDMMLEFHHRVFYQRLALEAGYEITVQMLTDNPKSDLPEGTFKIFMDAEGVQIEATV